MAFIRDDKKIKESSYTPKSGRISETGKYTGFFTKAYDHESESSSRAIRFEFVTDHGQTQQFDIYYWSGKKDEAIKFAFDVHINPLLSILDIDELDTKKAQVEIWDFDLRGTVKTKVDSYNDLLNKPIGCVFQMVEYKKNNGELSERAEFQLFFDAETEQTAKEKLLNESSEALDDFVVSLAPVKALVLGHKAETKAKDAKIVNLAKEMDDFDDDIVF